MKIDHTGVLRDDDGRIPACPKCGKRWEYDIGPGKAQHYARATCKACGYGWWLPKPGKRSNRESKHTDLVREYSRGFCELCGILADSVPKGESLEAHHVDEYATGGDSDRANIQILCTACHKLTHWRRTYLKHILPDGVKHVDRKERTGDDSQPASMGQLENDPAGPAHEDPGPVHGPSSEFDGSEDVGDV